MDRAFIPTGRLGRTLSRVVCDGFEVSLVRYPQRAVIPEHAHERDYLCFAARGAFRELGPRRAPIECSAGEMIVKPAGERHRDEFPVECTAINIEVEDWRRDVLADRRVAIEGTRKLRSERMTALGQQLHRELEVADELSPVVVEGLTLALFAECTRSRRRGGGSGNPRVRHVVRRLRECFPGIPGLRELAAELRIDPSALARSFRDATGKTIGEYGRALRIHRAMELLTANRLSLSQIACELGYSDQSHFTRSFKKAVGCTPAVYARSLR